MKHHNPLDPRNPQGYLAYLIVTEDERRPSRSPRNNGGKGCQTLLAFTAVALLLAMCSVGH